MAAQQWRFPAYAAAGATNVANIQSYNMLTKQTYIAVGDMPRPPLPGWGTGPVSPLTYAAASLAATQLPVLYGGSVMGNPARTASILAPSRGMIFGPPSAYDCAF